MNQNVQRRSTRELCKEMARLRDTITIAKFKLKELEAECDRRLQQLTELQAIYDSIEKDNNQ